MQISRNDNLKLNKDKCSFRCRRIPFFWEITSRDGVQLDPDKVHIPTEMPPPQNKNVSVINNHTQKRCSNTTVMTSMHLTIHTLIQHMHHTQTWSKSLNSRLAATMEPPHKLRPGKSQHKAEHQCYRNMQTHVRIHDNIQNMWCNTKWWAPISTYIICHWQLAHDQSRNKARHNPYWTLYDNLAVIDGIGLKGKRMVIPTSLLQHVLDQLHNNHTEIEKICLLT